MNPMNPAPQGAPQDPQADARKRQMLAQMLRQNSPQGGGVAGGIANGLQNVLASGYDTPLNNWILDKMGVPGGGPRPMAQPPQAPVAPPAAQDDIQRLMNLGFGRQ